MANGFINGLPGQPAKTVIFPPDDLAPVPDDGRAPVPLLTLRSEILRVVAEWQALGRYRSRLMLWAVEPAGQLLPVGSAPEDRAGRPPIIPPDAAGLAVGFPATRAGVPCGLEHQPRGIGPALGIATQIDPNGGQGRRQWGVVVSFGQPAFEAMAWLKARQHLTGLARGRWRSPFAGEVIDRLADHVARKPSLGWGNTSDNLKLLARQIADGKEAPFRWVYHTA